MSLALLETSLTHPCDHITPLINLPQTVSMNPYRYLFHQQNKIEKQKEMLAAEIIQYSSSSLASLLMLVCKFVWSWQLLLITESTTKTPLKISSIYP